MRSGVAVGRLLTAVALVVALAVSAAAAADTRPAHDFLLYFATQASIIAAAAWALSGAFLLARGAAPAWVHLLRAAAVSYAMVLAACRLLIALPWQASAGFPLPAVNVFIDLVAPLLLVLDWALVGDRRPLSPSFLRWVAAYPVLWSAVTLLHGEETGWTPYPLLNPATAGPRMPLFLAGTCLVALGAGAITSWMSRRAPLLPMSREARAVEGEASAAEPPSLAVPSPVDGAAPAPPVPVPLEEPAAPRRLLSLVEPPADDRPLRGERPRA